MANYENLKGHGFHERTAREQREIAVMGGKKSGVVRRRKAALRDTMNRLLTMKVEVEGLSDVLLADGGESTYEEVITMAMIQQAMMGDVKAYNAIMKVVGQTDKSDADLEEQKARTRQMRANTERIKKSSGDDDGEDGVEIVNDAPEESEDIGYSDSEVSSDIQQQED